MLHCVSISKMTTVCYVCYIVLTISCSAYLFSQHPSHHGGIFPPVGGWNTSYSSCCPVAWTGVPGSFVSIHNIPLPMNLEVTGGLVVRAGVSVTWTVLSWSGGHEFEPRSWVWVKLGVRGTSVLSRTWTKIMNLIIIPVLLVAVAHHTHLAAVSQISLFCSNVKIVMQK